MDWTVSSAPTLGAAPTSSWWTWTTTTSQEVREVDNPYYGHHQPGQVPAFINSLGANVMLTGGMGGRAIMFFQQFGIEGVTGAYGTVRQSVERYLGGELKGAAPCKESEEHGHGEASARSQPKASTKRTNWAG